MSFGTVATALSDSGVIRNRAAIVLYSRLRGFSHRIQAGRYRVSARQSAGEIVAMMCRGETVPIRIAFPEGIWLVEIAGALAESLSVDSAAVMAAAADPEILRDHGIPAGTAEGYLFPATYDFEGGEGSAPIVTRLLAEGEDRWSVANQDRADSLGLSRHEVLALASIIEAETARGDERAKVSAVYHRRLRRGMLLQADPTVVYANGIRGRPPTYADLESNSPYNTYRRVGLPPGPIGNPGQAAIEAALHPDPSCTALYFVAQPDGSHIFSNTFEEHVAARRRSRGR
jgi:UPF0755 protein